MFNINNGRKSILQDPRLNGEYQKFLQKQGGAPRNVPGQDFNAARQGMNAMQGTQYAAMAPRKPILNGGQQMQSMYRNRMNEQGGQLAQPKPPMAAQNRLSMKRTAPGAGRPTAAKPTPRNNQYAKSMTAALTKFQDTRAPQTMGGGANAPVMNGAETGDGRWRG